MSADVNPSTSRCATEVSAVRQLGHRQVLAIVLPVPFARKLKRQDIHDFEQEKGMSYITTAERVGLEKGSAKGREEGLLAGIEVALRIKFGQTGLALLSEIRQIDDVGLLRTVLDSVPHANSPTALRQVWRTPRSM
ncbi:MAG TPA: hypothetical protein VFI31_14455 [Pirellulales bacterium]|nr:hypothetical protein [Pirellulales bacterium]